MDGGLRVRQTEPVVDGPGRATRRYLDQHHDRYVVLYKKLASSSSTVRRQSVEYVEAGGLLVTMPMPMQCGPELGIRVRCRPRPKVLDILALFFLTLKDVKNDDATRICPSLLTVGRPCRIAGRRGHGIAASKWMEAHESTPWTLLFLADFSGGGLWGPCLSHHKNWMKKCAVNNLTPA